MCYSKSSLRSGSRAAALSKMEHFVIIDSGFQPLTIITKRSILDVAAALDPPLTLRQKKKASVDLHLTRPKINPLKF